MNWINLTLYTGTNIRVNTYWIVAYGPIHSLTMTKSMERGKALTAISFAYADSILSNTLYVTESTAMIDDMLGVE